MSSLHVVEGEVELSVPGVGKVCKTWYKTIGDLKAGRPLVLLHGGPGVSHDYLLSLTDLHAAQSIALVFYDQVGSGRSTHLPEKNGDTSFWTEQLFLDELDNLLSHLGIQDDYDLLGQSWGGMLCSRHAVRRPKGLKHLILANAVSDMGLWVAALNKLLLRLPQDVQDAVTKHEANGTYDSKEYRDAVAVFYAHFVCRLDPYPEDLMKSLANIEKDPTVYNTMYGQAEFSVIGSLKHWSTIDDLHLINVPTLILNSRYDEAQDSVVEPFFRWIPKVKWFTFAESSHMPHLEERERYMEVVRDFLVNM